MIRVAFYCRISTDEDRQKYSLPAQVERLEAYCTAQYGKDWKHFKTYRDMESGGHTRRPGLQEMLADAAERRFDALVVFKVDRLSRSVADAVHLVDKLREHGVSLISITESFDTATPAGKMMLHMLSSFGEYERDVLRERTRVGMEKKAKTGRFVGGSIPYGYRLDPDLGLVVVEDEAVLVRRMFRMYAEKGIGVYSICRNLNAAGYRKRNGKQWDRRVVLHMLRNPVYLGKLRWRQAIHDGLHEPIIEQALFDKVGHVLQGRSEDLKGRRWHNANSRMLTGVVSCTLCGGRMVGVSGRKNGRSIPYYACSKRISTQGCDQAYVRADHLESEILEDVKTLFRDDRFLDQVEAEANRLLGEEKPELERQITAVNTQTAKAKERLDRYYDAFEAGRLEPETLGQKIEELNGQLAALDEERERLVHQRERLELTALDRQTLLALLDQLDEVLASGTAQQRKHLLHRVVKEVRLHDRGTAEATYRVPAAPSVRTLEQLAPPQVQCATSIFGGPEVCVRVVPVLIRGRRRRSLPLERRVDVVVAALAAGGAPRAATFRFCASDLPAAIPASRMRLIRAGGDPATGQLLRKALVWRALLEARALPSRAAVARLEGLSRARVTQVLNLLRLEADLRARLLDPAFDPAGPYSSERNLRGALARSPNGAAGGHMDPATVAHSDTPSTN